MLAQIHERFAQYPRAALVDGGFVKHADIDTVSAPAKDCTVYAPVPKPKDAAQDRYAPRPTDSVAVGAWRQRMATAECVNALARNRGLRQLPVRGVAKVKALVLWYAVAHNVMRALSLHAAVGMAG